MLSIISPASPDELTPALNLIFGGRAGADGLIEPYRTALTSGDRDPQGLHVARDSNGGLRGAMLAQPLQGALGIMWPPKAEAVEIEDALVLAAADWLRGRGVKVCQVFATPEELTDLAPLVRHGFQRTTELVFMSRDLSPDESLPEPIHPIIFIPESPPFSPEFREALLSTHERSMDCPELNGERTADELLAGFADWVPGNEWYLAVDRDVVLGVVLFAAGTEPDVLELSYLGVVPLFRQCGFGTELLDFAIAAATLSKVNKLVVTVDARNEPGLRLYRKRGFVETARHEVFLAHWPAVVPPEN
ncbi:MAG: GNAT family N-acetyltransferase [Planctomycetes bacterium]|nr:GNAT family N-acetyltransferase [Planctomycetota bacterium]